MVNTMIEILKKLISKPMFPRVFGIVLKVDDGECFEIVTAYSLEEAHFKAVEAVKKQIPSIARNGTPKILMYSRKEFSELLAGFLERDLPKLAEQPKVVTQKGEAPVVAPSATIVVPPPKAEGKTIGDLLGTSKNILMAQIVKEKNKGLLEGNKELFSEAEYKYLSEQIKK